MGRRALSWLLALPLLAGGSLLGHGLAYRLAHPGDARRHEVLEATGHGYLGQLAFLAGGLAAMALAGFATAVATRRTPAPAWPLALLPPVGFAAQEHLERLFAGDPGWAHLLAEPTFLVGVALQLPFALVALLLARLLARAALVVAAVLARASSRRRPPLRSLRPLEVSSGRLPPLALACAGRAPPLLP